MITLTISSWATREDNLLDHFRHGPLVRTTFLIVYVDKSPLSAASALIGPFPA